MNTDRSRIVITKAGIHIGGHYVPKPPSLTSQDADAIQSALLNDAPPLIERLSDFAERAAGTCMAVGAIGGVTFGIVKFYFLH